METLKDVVRGGRDRDGVAIDSPSRRAPYRYLDFCTDVWKVGNLYSHYGVQNGGTVAVVPRGPPTADVGARRCPTIDGSPPDSAIPLLGILGGAVIGSTVTVPTSNPVAAGIVLTHVDDLADVEIVGQSSMLAYGGDSERATVERFESGLWSENPVEPPEAVAPDDDCLALDGEVMTHGEIVGTATAIAEKYGVEEGASVSLMAPLTDPGAVIAGFVMPLIVGATIHLGTGGKAYEREADFLVASDGSATNPGRHIPTDDALNLLRED